MKRTHLPRRRKGALALLLALLLLLPLPAFAAEEIAPLLEKYPDESLQAELNV